MVDAVDISKDHYTNEIQKAIDGLINEKTEGDQPGSNFFNVKEFGAVGDGLHDDSEAVQQVLTMAGKSGRGVVFFPEGKYKLNKRVSWIKEDADGKFAGLVVKGEGVSKSILFVDNQNGGVLLDDPSGKTRFQVKNMSIIAVRAEAGTALQVGKQGNKIGGLFFRCFIGENLEIKGNSDKDYFSRGLIVSSLFRPLYRNISFIGPESMEADAGNYLSGVGISTDWCYSPEVDYCTVINAERGFSFVAGPPDAGTSGPEAGTFHYCKAINCGIGIDIDQPSTEPGLAINYCQLKTRKTGIRIARKKFYQIRNNVFEPMLDPGKFVYQDIATSGCFMGVYHYNIFKEFADASSKESLRTCLSFDACDWIHGNSEMIIMNNLFPENGEMIGGDEKEEIGHSSIIKENLRATKEGAEDLLRQINNYAYTFEKSKFKAITGPVFSITDFGANGTDTEDDADAVQKAMKALLAEGKGILYIPAGNFYIGHKIFATIEDRSSKGVIIITGEGSGVSRLICNNTEGIFDFKDRTGSKDFHLRDLGLFAKMNGATAVNIESVGTDKEDGSNLFVRNVEIQALEETYHKHIHFRNGLLAKGFSSAYIDNYIFLGFADRRYSMPVEDLTEYGIKLDDCNRPVFRYTYIWRANQAIFISGEVCDNAYFYRTRAVENVFGLTMETEFPSRGLWMESCHVNNVSGNVSLKNVYDFVLLDNLPYMETPRIPFAPTEEHVFRYDYLLENCQNGIISGNVYQAPVIHNYRPEPPSSRTAVIVRGKESSGIQITKNIYNAKGRSFRAEKGFGDITFRDNLYPNPVVEH